MVNEEELKLQKLELENDLLRIQISKTSFESIKLELENNKMLIEKKFFSFHKLTVIIPILTTIISISLGVWGGIITYNKYFDDKTKDKELEVEKIANYQLVSVIDSLEHMDESKSNLSVRNEAVFLAYGKYSIPLLMSTYTNEYASEQTKNQVPYILKNIRAYSKKNSLGEFDSLITKYINNYIDEYPNDSNVICILNLLKKDLKIK